MAMDMAMKEFKLYDNFCAPPAVVVTFGVWDLLHIGHVRYLKEAKKCGRKLVVGVQRDESVKEEKGLLPIVPEVQRAKMLTECGLADETVLYWRPNYLDVVIEVMRFICNPGEKIVVVLSDSVRQKDGSLDERFVPLREWLRASGKGFIQFLAYSKDVSTTELKKKVVKMACDHNWKPESAFPTGPQERCHKCDAVRFLPPEPLTQVSVKRTSSGAAMNRDTQSESKNESWRDVWQRVGAKVSEKDGSAFKNVGHTPTSAPMYANRVSHILNLLPHRPGAIIDYGCGSGVVMRALQTYLTWNPMLIGIDVSEGLLACAGQLNPTALFMKADKFPFDSYTSTSNVVAYSIAVLHYLESIEEAMCAVFRMKNTCGLVYLMNLPNARMRVEREDLRKKNGKAMIP